MQGSRVGTEMPFPALGILNPQPYHQRLNQSSSHRSQSSPAIGQTMAIDPNSTTRTLRETVWLYRIAAADLILRNGPRYARGRGPTIGEECRRKRRREWPLPRLAAL